MMGINMKYIVFADKRGEEYIVVFPQSLSHFDIANNLSTYRVTTDIVNDKWHRDNFKPISAGFIDSSGCYGRSETLDLNSRPKDTELWERYYG